MRALSLTRPWTALVLAGGKDVENRTWRTSYRGRIWVHGAKSQDSYAASEMAERILGWSGLAELRSTPLWTATGILGFVEIYDCVRGHDSPWAMPDQWQFLIRDPHLLDEPVPCRGSLGFWDLPAEVAAILR